MIIEVRSGTKGPQIVLSRRSEELIRELFELEVPEIADGLVVIRAVAREAGYRAKIAVESRAQGVDPVGACVGPRGSRVRMVVAELRGEKIDIIPWNDEPARFVAKALAPARVREVLVDDENEQATVIVPDDQLSLAIGREGQNARLAPSSPAGASTSRARPSSPRRRPRSPSPAARATTPSAAAARPSSARAGAARTARCRAPATAASPRIASSRRAKRRPPEHRTPRADLRRLRPPRPRSTTSCGSPWPPTGACAWGGATAAERGSTGSKLCRPCADGARPDTDAASPRDRSRRSLEPRSWPRAADTPMVESEVRCPRSA